jgi:release factor glutamine methyltransferase
VTLFETAARARTLLIDAGILPNTATLDADLLARHALQWDLATWIARRSEPATEDFTRRFEELVARRATREPVAYIRGVQEFWGRDFIVSPAVLIPRPETELLVEVAHEVLRNRKDAVVVDVGTGSGCIAITLALEHPGMTVYATDVSTDALANARANAQRLGAGRVRFSHGVLLADVPPPVDLIVSNPPYVAERDRAGLPKEVRDYEPADALFGGPDGWRVTRALLSAASSALTEDGLLLVELGYGQSEDLPAEVARVQGLSLESIHADLQGIPRVARVRRRTGIG